MENYKGLSGLCKDNATAESACTKGSSSSKLLFQLILRLWKLEMQSGCKMHVSHVAGTCMIPSRRCYARIEHERLCAHLPGCFPEEEEQTERLVG